MNYKFPHEFFSSSIARISLTFCFNSLRFSSLSLLSRASFSLCNSILLNFFYSFANSASLFIILNLLHAHISIPKIIPLVKIILANKITRVNLPKVSLSQLSSATEFSE